MDQGKSEKLKSDERMPMEDVLELLEFRRNALGALERRWPQLTVSTTEWLGAWHFICSWVTQRRAGIPEFRAPPTTSPVELLSVLYQLCEGAFKESAEVPPELEIGRRYLEYQRKIRDLTPPPPTVWADREFFRFCLSYIERANDWSTADYRIAFKFYNGQLCIAVRETGREVYCPARGTWLDTSEVSGRDLFRRAPKRFTSLAVSLKQEGQALVVDGHSVPATWIEQPDEDTR
jgi:hypothetical protein